jgi:hypothetical protein
VTGRTGPQGATGAQGATGPAGSGGGITTVTEISFDYTSSNIPTLGADNLGYIKAGTINSNVSVPQPDGTAVIYTTPIDVAVGTYLLMGSGYFTVTANFTNSTTNYSLFITISNPTVIGGTCTLLSPLQSSSGNIVGTTLSSSQTLYNVNGLTSSYKYPFTLQGYVSITNGGTNSVKINANTFQCSLPTGSTILATTWAYYIRIA